jgi:hypothetical protein
MRSATAMRLANCLPAKSKEASALRLRVITVGGGDRCNK